MYDRGECDVMMEVDVMGWGGWVSWDDGSEYDGMMGVDVMV